MVGVLTDKHALATGVEFASATSLALGSDGRAVSGSTWTSRAEERIVSVELSEEQLQILRAQWDAIGTEGPTQVVLYAGSRRVGEVRITDLRVY